MHFFRRTQMVMSVNSTRALYLPIVLLIFLSIRLHKMTLKLKNTSAPATGMPINNRSRSHESDPQSNRHDDDDSSDEEQQQQQQDYEGSGVF